MYIFTAHGERELEDYESLKTNRFMINDYNIYVTFTKSGEKLFFHHINLINNGLLNVELRSEIEKVIRKLRCSDFSYIKLKRLQSFLLYKIINQGCIEILYNFTPLLNSLITNKSFVKSFNKEFGNLRVNKTNSVENMKKVLSFIWNNIDVNMHTYFREITSNYSSKNDFYGITYILNYILLNLSRGNVSNCILKTLPKIISNKILLKKIIYNDILNLEYYKKNFSRFCDNCNLELKIYFSGLTLPKINLDFKVLENNKYQFNKIYKFGLYEVNDYFEKGYFEESSYTTDKHNLQCNRTNSNILQQIINSSYTKSILPTKERMSELIDCDETTKNLVLLDLPEIPTLESLLEKIKLLKPRINNQIIFLFFCSAPKTKDVKPKLVRQYSDLIKQVELKEKSDEESIEEFSEEYSKFLSEGEENKDDDVPKKPFKSRYSENIQFSDDIQNYDQQEEIDTIDINDFEPEYEEYQDEEFSDFTQSEANSEYIKEFQKMNFNRAIRDFLLINHLNLYFDIKKNFIKLVDKYDMSEETYNQIVSKYVRKNILTDEKLDNAEPKLINLSKEHNFDIREVKNEIFEIWNDDITYSFKNTYFYIDYYVDNTMLNNYIYDIIEICDANYYDLLNITEENDKFYYICKIYKKYKSEYNLLDDFLFMTGRVISESDRSEILKRWESEEPKKIYSYSEYEEDIESVSDIDELDERKKNDEYKKKYLKYKTKYLQLKKSF